MIRKAVMDDLDSINTVSKELGYKESAYDESLSRLKSVLDSPCDELYVFDDGMIKGWIHFFRAVRVASAPFIEIGGLAVLSEFRRNGIGRLLVDFAVKHAEENGLKTRVRCSSKRTETHDFYKSTGFTCTKEQFVFERK